IEARASHHDGALAPGVDVINDGAAFRLEVRHAGFLRDVFCVQQMVWHTLALVHSDLGRTDVHAPIELQGVSVDDLAIERKGQLDAKARFTRPGWAADCNYRRRGMGKSHSISNNRRQALRTGSDGMPKDTPFLPGAAPALGTPQESACERSQASPALDRRNM